MGSDDLKTILKLTKYLFILVLFSIVSVICIFIYYSHKINYEIPKSGFVQLKIYDLLGREIAVLVNEVKSKGRYTESFDASSLPSGVYIYSLRVNDFVQNNKMTLLK